MYSPTADAAASSTEDVHWVSRFENLVQNESDEMGTNINGKRGMEGGSSSSSEPQPGPSRKKVVQDLTEDKPKLPIITEMDLPTLRGEHNKLSTRFREQTNHIENLQERIETLEQRQHYNDHVLSVINRYWNQLDEDIRLLLERFDAATARDWQIGDDEFSSGISFLSQLGTWDLKELDEKLETRHRVSAGAVAKVIQAFDRLQQRQERLVKALREDEATLAKVLGTNSRRLEEENKEMSELNERIKNMIEEMRKNMDLLREQIENKHAQLQVKANDREDSREVVDMLTLHIDTVRRYSIWFKGIIEEQDKKVKDKIREGGACLEEIPRENKELEELAEMRLEELKQVFEEHKEALVELEGLHADLKVFPETKVMETGKFKGLQSKYSVVYNENLQLKASLEEAKKSMWRLRDQQVNEITELEEKARKKQVEEQVKIMNIQETINGVRREYELLKLDYEANKIATDEAKPVSEEMHRLIRSMEGRKEQLKVEGNRYRRKYGEALKEHGKLKMQVDELRRKWEGKQSASKDNREERMVKEVRSQLKKSLNEQRELKLLLDMYKGAASKEQEEKVRLMASERKLRDEAEEVRKQIRALEEESRPRDDNKRLTAEEADKRIKMLEEQKSALEKQVASQKQEDETLVGEMEVTAQAFDDMQENNLKLLQQLREKDSANFKLVSEKVKADRMQKYMKEELDLLRAQFKSLDEKSKRQKDVQNLLDEKNKVVEDTKNQMRKERDMRTSAEEVCKNKTQDERQLAAETKQEVDRCRENIEKARKDLVEKTVALETEKWKKSRMLEEMTRLKQSSEKMKELDVQSCRFEVLQEEIREYKELLTCSICGTNKKDAVLTRCFHAFCYSCIQTRYERGHRKCPICNIAFGANNFHKLFYS